MMDCKYLSMCNPTENRCKKCGTEGYSDLKVLYSMILETHGKMNYEKIEKTPEENDINEWISSDLEGPDGWI